jgi:hypothetical protein
VRQDPNLYNGLWCSTGVGQKGPDGYYSGLDLWVTSSTLPTEVDAKLSQEALDVLERSLKACLEQDTVYTMSHMAYEGRPLYLPEEQTPEKIQEWSKAGTESWNKWKGRQFFQEFAERKLKPVQHSVFLFGFPEKRSKKSVRKLPVAALQDPKKYADVIVVRFRYENTRDLIKGTSKKAQFAFRL